MPTSDWHPAKVTEYPIPADGTPPPWRLPGSLPDPFGITTGPDGNIWFTELLTNRIGRIARNGRVTQFPVPVDEDQPDPVQIVTGGDGALWFATSEGLGRITTGGRITMYPAAGDLTEGPISHIAPAADGAWFGNGILGHVGKNGVVRRFEHATRKGDLIESVFTGADHRVWALLEHFPTRDGPPLILSNVLPGGSLRPVLAFSLPTSGYPNISSIIAARDGTFWLSEGGGQSAAPFDTSIDQLFLDGRIVRHATLPSAYHVIEGPRGTVLVQGLDYLSKISPDGSLSTYDPRCRYGGLCIGGVVTAPDGTIWLTITDGMGRILKIRP